MRIRWVAIVLIASLSGCAWLTNSRKYSVYFQPYSSELDQQALATVHEASSFARRHPLQLVTVDGFSAPPNPELDTEGLSAQRADKVRQILVDDGVGRERITTVASGITNPKSLPALAVRRVDINVGK